MSKQLEISAIIAMRVGTALGIDWTRIDRNEFRRGLEIELEREWGDPHTKPHHHNLVCTGKAVLKCIEAASNYYTRLEQLITGDGACAVPHGYEIPSERFRCACSLN